MIREAWPAEAAALTALALRSKAHWGYPEAFMEACREELTISAEDLHAEHLSYRVMEQAGAMVGFYCLERLGRGQFELEALFVEPDFIGQGCGRALLAHALALATALDGSSVLIQGDPHAEAFYRAAGGEQIGTRPSGSIPGRELPLFRISLPA